MSEKTEAKRDGAKLQPNSGRGQYSKGDAVTDWFVIDYKEYSKSYTVDRKSWAKICTDAVRVDRDKSPALKIILGKGNSKVRLGVLAWSKIESMTKEIELLRKRVQELEGD